MGALLESSRASVTSEHAVRKPNFFIIGAPKCGTTAMHEYLRQHPQVFMSCVKEPHYFCSDFPEYRRVRTEGEYQALFAEAGDELIVGESSVFYLYSTTAVPAVAAFAPDAKFLVMLRNPLDMLPSLHAQLVYSFREDEPDFAAAWRLHEARAQGRYLPPGCLAPEHLQYREVARFGSQLRRVFAQVDRRQVHVVLYDDFAQNTKAEYDKVLRFLELPQVVNVVFKRVNQYKSHRWPALSRLLMRPPEPVMRLKQSLKNRLGVHATTLSKLIYRSLSSQGQRESLDGETQNEIVRCMRDDVRGLQDLLGRDLTHWGFGNN